MSDPRTTMWGRPQCGGTMWGTHKAIRKSDRALPKAQRKCKRSEQLRWDRQIHASNLCALRRRHKVAAVVLGLARGGRGGGGRWGLGRRIAWPRLGHPRRLLGLIAGRPIARSFLRAGALAVVRAVLFALLGLLPPGILGLLLCGILGLLTRRVLGLLARRLLGRVAGLLLGRRGRHSTGRRACARGFLRGQKHGLDVATLLGRCSLRLGLLRSALIDGAGVLLALLCDILAQLLDQVIEARLEMRALRLLRLFSGQQDAELERRVRLDLVPLAEAVLADALKQAGIMHSLPRNIPRRHFAGRRQAELGAGLDALDKEIHVVPALDQLGRVDRDRAELDVRLVAVLRLLACRLQLRGHHREVRHAQAVLACSSDDLGHVCVDVAIATDARNQLLQRRHGQPAHARRLALAGGLLLLLQRPRGIFFGVERHGLLAGARLRQLRELLLLQPLPLLTRALHRVLDICGGKNLLPGLGGRVVLERDVHRLELLQQLVARAAVLPLLRLGALQNVVDVELLVVALALLEELLRPELQDGVKLLGREVWIILGHVDLGPALGIHRLDHEVVQDHFALGALQDVLLDAAPRDQAVDVYLPLLPDAVRASLRLQVVLGIPVAVEENDRVCGREVDTETARPRRQQKAEVHRIRRVEVVDGLATNVGGDAAVEALERVAAQAQVHCQDVEHHDHLREDQHTVPALLQALQQLVQQQQLRAPPQ
eukprot:m.154711 g.154711  ORF g.154711 m.154711 type:complete len:714 (-) comp9794_c1_seq1:2621-4762(-)